MEQLEQEVGVSPSDGWLEACRAHLQTIHEDSPDAILQQILHTDLRDVVRVVSGNASSPPPEAATALRQAVQNSNNSKQSLPASFRILIQVEEVLDVSLNAEARISVGPASTTNPTPIGNQRNRCLKLSVSDGYTCSGSRQCNESDKSKNVCFNFTAIETSPIPSLSVHSKAGVKVLIKGPAVIRFGVLMLNEGNAKVLGGCVPSLMEVQRKALEQARRIAGIGVDPTVKALIWNPLDGDEEEQDEGEHESRDVTVVTPPPAAPQRVQANATTPAATQAAPPATVPPAPTAASSIRPAPTPAASAATRALPPASAPAAQMNPRVPSQPALQTNHPHSVSHQRPSVPTQSAGIRLDETPQAFEIPSKKSAASPNNTGRFNNPYRNPYASVSSNASIAAPPQLAVSTAASVGSGAADSPVDLITPTNEATLGPCAPRTNETLASSQDTLTTADEKSILCASVGGEMGVKSAVESLSFPDLKNLLLQVIKDQALYRKYESHVFLVEARQTGKGRYFNIEKKTKKKKRKKGDKKQQKEYEYVIHINTAGPDEKDGTITCKVANSILAPHFGLPPNEMRVMNKADKAKSKTLVAEGGQKARTQLLLLKPSQMTLLLPAEEFFEKDTPQLDGEQPIMLILRRDDV